jgi:hypothetical protein
MARTADAPEILAVVWGSALAERDDVVDLHAHAVVTQPAERFLEEYLFATFQPQFLLVCAVGGCASSGGAFTFEVFAVLVAFAACGRLVRAARLRAKPDR